MPHLKIRCCVALLHVSNVRNVHHQCQCTVENKVQLSGITLPLYLEIWQNRYLQGACQYGNELSGSIKCRECLD